MTNGGDLLERRLSREDLLRLAAAICSCFCRERTQYHAVCTGSSREGGEALINSSFIGLFGATSSGDIPSGVLPAFDALCTRNPLPFGIRCLTHARG